VRPRTSSLLATSGRDAASRERWSTTRCLTTRSRKGHGRHLAATGSWAAGRFVREKGFDLLYERWDRSTLSSCLPVTDHFAGPSRRSSLNWVGREGRLLWSRDSGPNPSLVCGGGADLRAECMERALRLRRRGSDGLRGTGRRHPSGRGRGPRCRAGRHRRHRARGPGHCRHWRASATRSRAWTRIRR